MADRRIADAHVDIGASNREYLRKLDEIERNLSDLERKFEKTNIGIEKSTRKSVRAVDDLNDNLKSTRRTIDRLNREGRIDPKVSRKAQDDLKKLEAQIARMDDKDIRIAAQIVGNVNQELKDLERGIARIDGKEIHVPVDTEVPSAIASLEVLDREISRLDGKEINIDVDTDSLRRGAANANIFTRGISLLAAVAALKLPVILAALGLAANGIAQLGGGAIALIAPLQSVVGETINLTGALSRAAPILVVFAGGLAAIASAAIPVILSLKSTIKETQKVAAATVEAERLTGAEREAALKAAEDQYNKLTAAQKALVPLQIAATKALQEFNDELSGPAARIWRNLLVAGLGTLQNLTDELKGGANAVGDFTGQLRALVAAPETQGFFSNLVNTGTKLIRILTGPLLRGFQAITRILNATLPVAVRVGEGLGRLLDKFSAFIRKAQQEGSLATFFEEAYYFASLLWKVLGNLASALLIVFRGTQKESAGFLHDLIGITERFERFMKRVQASGELQKFLEIARREFNLVIGTIWELGRVLVGVFRAALPAGEILFESLRGFLKDTGDAINEVSSQSALREFFMGTIPFVKEFGRLLLAVGGAFLELGRKHGPLFLELMQRLRTEVLPALVNWIGKATEALGHDLIDAFISFVGVATVLVGPSGPIRLLIKLLKALFDAFNAMPGVIQIFIVNLLGIQVVGKILGVNFFGYMFTQFARLFQHFKTLRAEIIATEAVASATTGGAAAGGGGFFAKLFRRGAPAAGAAAPAAGFGVTAAGTTAAAGGMAAFTAAMVAALPVIAAIIVGILALGAAFLAIRDNFLGVTDVLKAIFDEFANAFRDLGEAFSEFSDAITGGHTEEVVHALGVAFSFLGKYLIPVLTSLAKLIGIFVIIGAAITIGPVVAGIYVLIKGLTLLIKVITTVIGWVKSLLGWISQLPGAFGAFHNFFMGLPGLILNSLKGLPRLLFDAAVSWGKSIVNGVKEGIKGLGGAIGDKLGGLNPLSTGGPVPGAGTGDKVSAVLEPGEYVIRRSVAQRVGRRTLDRLNFGGRAMGLAVGRNKQGGGAIGGILGGGDAGSIGGGLRFLNQAVGSFGKDIKATLDGILAHVKEVFAAIREEVRKQLDALEAITKTKFDKMLEKIRQTTAKSKETASASFKSIGAAAGESFSEILKKSGIFDEIPKKAEKSANKTKKSLGKVGEVMTVIYDKAGKKVGETLEFIGDKTADVLDAVGDRSGNDIRVKTKKRKLIQRTATGARLGGAGLADTIPIMAAPGEVILNRHQESYLESLTGAPGILDHVLSAVNRPHYMAEGGRTSGLQPGILKAANLILNRFKGLVITSGLRSGDSDSWHGKGMAADIAGSVGIMSRAAKWISGSGMHKQLREGIFNPDLSVEGGKKVPSSFWGSKTWAAHANHIHLAVTGLISGLADKITAPIATGPLSGMANAIFKKVTRAANKRIEGSMASTTGHESDPVPGGKKASSAQLRSWLTKALKITGLLTPANLTALTGRALQESGGNPRAINLWDSNAKAGTPSKGLLQTIPSTFKAYMLKGFGDIWNPIHNAIAAIRYMMSRYGHIVGPSSTGYARGGRIGAATGVRVPPKGKEARIKQQLAAELALLSDEASALLSAFGKRWRIQFHKNFKGFFGWLDNFIGKDLDFTKKNMRQLASLLAAEKTLRQRASAVLPKDDKDTKINERKAAAAARSAARGALGEISSAIVQMLEDIASKARERFDAFRTWLQRGQALNESRFSPTQKSTSAVSGLDKLSPEKMKAFLEALKGVSRELDRFNMAQRLNAQVIRVGQAEITSLGQKLRLLEKIAKKTGKDISGAMNTIRGHIVDAARDAIDAINAWFDEAKARLDQGLSDRTEALEKDRTTELTAAEKTRDDRLKLLDDAFKKTQDAYDVEVKKFEEKEQAISRAQEREQRRRDRMATQRQLGKLLGQEFLTEEDIESIVGLQEQLADQLRANADAERQIVAQDVRKGLDERFAAEQKKYEEARAAAEAEYTAAVDAINAKYDGLIAVAQEEYAAAIVQLNTDAQAMIQQIIDQAATALGVQPGQIWDLILGGGTKPKEKGEEAADAVTRAIRSRRGDLVDAGEDLMEAMGRGITKGGPKAVNALKAVLREMGRYLPSSDAEIGPLSNLTSSGEAFWKAFGKGMDKGFSEFNMQVPQIPMPNGAANGHASQFTNERVIRAHHTFDINLDARGLTEKEKKELIRETSKQIARESQFEELTAPNAIARTLVA